MQLKIYLLINLYLILNCTYYFVNIEALVGNNVRPAEENEFPFIVAIIKNYINGSAVRRYSCTGSLISRNDILTSEHCISTEILTRINVLVGSSYLDQSILYYPEWWITFDQWSAYNNHDIVYYKNDIGILNLVDRVSNNVEPAQIMLSPIRPWLYETAVQMAGWGKIRDYSVPNILQTGSVMIMTREACDFRMSTLSGTRIVGDERIICSAADPYVLSRPGDSGSPLFYNNLLIGVNYGTAPDSTSYFHPDEVNIHLHIFFYYNFIYDLQDLY